MTRAREPASDARRRAWALDGALALVVAAVEVGQVFGYDRTPPDAAVGLAFAAAAVLVLRRRAPLAVLALSLAGVAGVAIAGVAPAAFAPLVGLYTVAARCERRESLAALGLTLAVGAAVAAASSADFQPFDPIVVVVCTFGAWGLGIYVETRREHRRELGRRAADAARDRDQQARLAVHEERASIARELHDIVAHSVSVMLVGVRGARDVLRTAPDVADDTLARVETSGEQSLVELRRILALLRARDDGAESRPQPSLAELEELVGEYRGAGLPVSLDITGEPRRLAGGIELSVYRIVQEALTNVLKHSRPSRVTVTLAFRDARLDVEVVDDGTDDAAGIPTIGHGLVGMRERVALLGGELEAGRRDGGGFRVAASLPAGET
jgi:signal transduction histidine kinase